MFIVVGLMCLGIIIGFAIREKVKVIQVVEVTITFAIYLLLLLLGISVGTNEIIISNLGTLGINGILLGIGGVSGSVILSFFVYKKFFEIRE